MATYAQASQARELIRETARLNNVIVRTLNSAATLKAQLDALDPGQRTIVETAVADMGYDATEIYGVLTSLEAVKTEADAQGLAEIPQPA